MGQFDNILLKPPYISNLTGRFNQARKIRMLLENVTNLAPGSPFKDLE